jgi:hypothetical protein
VFVKLTLDAYVRYQFYWAGTLPAALLEQIGPQKIEIYQSLTVDSENPDMRIGSRVFTAEGRRFEVIFVSDPEQIDRENDIHPLCVAVVTELE